VTRRIAVGAAAVLAALAVVVVVGRWQENRDIAKQRRGMAAIFALAEHHPIPDAWRIAPPFRCLLYRDDTNPFAYELCFDPYGRLVEAIDRRSHSPEVSSLRSQWPKASIKVDSGALDIVLRQMKAFDPRSPQGPAVRPGPWFNLKLRPPRIPPGSGLP
jgi:hypothetical protein